MRFVSTFLNKRTSVIDSALLQHPNSFLSIPLQPFPFNGNRLRGEVTYSQVIFDITIRSFCFLASVLLKLYEADVCCPPTRGCRSPCDQVSSHSLIKFSSLMFTPWLISLMRSYVNAYAFVKEILIEIFETLFISRCRAYSMSSI